ncbi:hypothetical protein Cassandra_0360 [Pseudomonas phage Cassandra]|nr:hypothetical protein Cassandra_0360 [Pseudomonas phage Cassandra]
MKYKIILQNRSNGVVAEFSVDNEINPEIMDTSIIVHEGTSYMYTGSGGSYYDTIYFSEIYKTINTTDLSLL